MVPLAIRGMQEVKQTQRWVRERWDPGFLFFVFFAVYMLLFFNWSIVGEENGNPLQYSCLENPMDRGAWWVSPWGRKESGWLSNNIVVLQCCASLCCTVKWTSYMYTYIPFLLDLPPPPHHPSHLSHHRALSWAPCVYSSFPLGSVWHMVVYIHQSYSPNSPYPSYDHMSRWDQL